ncbi:hypothetical protein [Halapricum hydrolyticum]|uniref:Uncharacterized protein n=1 Tax=Halapricum hydrolyticum TaxID=2979991 RepID=A0AAE3IAH5_9EURY|nr:hypothetical protein [Halapricum hydrolyticum]MCU4718385.1 hypothetical protein [Halapricum hydrolyticum]MCU4726502.1 hypothetical protein [Halapricum hydrolyticum]
MDNPKHIALYDPAEEVQWEQAEKVVRDKYSAGNAREGEVLAEICAAYVGYDGPLSRGEE